MQDLNEINKYLNNWLICFQTFPLPGKGQQQNRLYIREQIATFLQDTLNNQVSDRELTALMSLKARPRFKNFNVSISHTKDYGGFVVTPPEVSVGLDIEIVKRVSPQIIERVATPQELKLFKGRHHYLWAFKEAAFKCLAGKTGAKTISDIVVQNLDCNSSTICSTNHIVAKNHDFTQVKGLGFQMDRFVVGIVATNLLTLVQ